ncbi:MAG: tetratricopeptide repeat protein [Phycisphaerae bacterium]|jgi:tetratricopeptide (TPR) repeat protein|nr:tetratricopeptide repeat protein [Phycisphaerae bacterium]
MSKSKKTLRKSASTPLVWLGVFGCLGVAAVLVFFLIPRKNDNAPSPNTRGTTLPAAQGSVASKFPTTLPAKPVVQAISPEMKLLIAEILKTEALNVCRKMQKDFPSSTAPLVLTADLHEKLGDHTKAVKLLREVLKREPGRMEIYLYLVDVAERSGAYEEAISLCRTALQLGSPPPGMYQGVGSCLLQLGKPWEALDALPREIQDFPKSAPYDILGKAHLQMKQYEKAVASFEKMLAIAPNDSSSCYGLAIAWARLGKSDKAMKYREKFVGSAVVWTLLRMSASTKS